MSSPSNEEQNPYATSEQKRPLPERAIGKGVWKAMAFGIAWSVVSAFPVAGFLALVYRFPVPLLGYVSGIDAIVPAMIGVFVYGVLLGGFVLLAGLGALIAFVVHRLDIENPRQRTWIVAIASVVGTVGCLLLLALLDKIIGSW